ncbi:S1 family peptidase [Blastococcus sp. SYSU DS1024]
MATTSPTVSEPGSSDPTTPGSTTQAEPSPVPFEEIIREATSGVVRLEVSTCDTGGIGSGFMLAPTLVLTVAHVVDDGEVLRVVQGTTSTSARILGIDHSADVALLETAAPLQGHFFTLAAEPPEITDRLAVLGFPDGAPLTVTQGTVNGLDRKAVIDGLARHSLIEHDAASTSGSSGGPVLNTDGEVIGLHDAGPTNGREGGNWAVSGRLAQERVGSWMETPQDVPLVECPDAKGPEGVTVPEAQIDAATARHVASTLNVYFRAINNGDFATAFAQRTPQDMDFERFRDAVRTSQDYGFAVHEARRAGDEVIVWLTFTSQQEAGAGPQDRPDETCTDWSLDYRFQQVNGLWLIAGSSPHGGGPGSTPCGVDGGTQQSTGAPAEDPSGD